jgi:hypothetical protein
MTVINSKRTIYGLPLSIPAGSAGTRITIKECPTARNAAGCTARIIAGEYTPAVLPPVESGAIKKSSNGSGTAIRVVTPTRAQNPSGIAVRVITPVKVTMGSGMSAGQI